jgi:NitT/TauT family transport system ATP-binding protein
MKNENCISIKDLDVFYQQDQAETVVLKSINLSLTKGKIGVIIGPSGCGKSTLLNLLAGLHNNFRGEVSIDGQAPSKKLETALILQDYGLLPWKTIADNIRLGLQIQKVSKEEATIRTEQVLEQVGLSSLAKRFPSQLSGGQRQRIAIARSLVLKSNILLMDEPFSSLDALTREEMQDLLLEIWQGSNLSILLVTHSIEEAVFLGEEIFVMSSSPGRIKYHLSNSLAGDYQSRGKIEFLKMTNKIRSLLQGGSHEKIRREYSI